MLAQYLVSVAWSMRVIVCAALLIIPVIQLTLIGTAVHSGARFSEALLMYLSTTEFQIMDVVFAACLVLFILLPNFNLLDYISGNVVYMR